MKLKNLIPKDELELKLEYGCCEIDSDFLCFEENYAAVAKYLTSDFTVVDLGCYQAAQCYLFKHCKRYIGVDIYDSVWDGGYVPPLRFYTDNTRHFVMSIQDYLSKEFPDVNSDKTYFIMSAVPNMEMYEKILKEEVANIAIFYPGETPYAKGFHAFDILREWHRLLDSRMLRSA